MIKDIQELNFPSYATMSAATVSQPDMGEWNITSQIKIDGEIAPDFSFDWEVVHDGHKYIMPLRKPQGSKENTSLNSVIDLTFQHWAIYQLKRWPFVTMQPIDSGTAVADEEVATVSLNLGDFCNLFNQVLAYYYGDKITIQLNPDWQYKAEAEVITISHTKVWNVLIEVFYKQFGVRWQIEPNGSPDKYVIKVGYPTTEQSHIFEYGFEGGLMKVESQVQSDEICNMLKGRGGEKNLPYRYFKNIDPENPSFKADPDWIEELANIYFSNLMPATFRSYVQGWKAAHISKYPGYTAVGETNAYTPWAYRKGFTDTKFHPIEFVADEITIDPKEGDGQVEILPGYSPFVKKGSSLDKYGPLMNSLDNNDEIYPTIQGVTVDPYGRIDEAVYVEQITNDNVEEAAESDAQIADIEGAKMTVNTFDMETVYPILDLPEFTVEEGMTANINPGVLTIKAEYKLALMSIWHDISDSINHLSTQLTVINVETGERHSAANIPAGRWRWQARFGLEVNHEAAPEYHAPVRITVGYEAPKLQYASIGTDKKWTNTFDILVKNIWGTSKTADETEAAYAERVWNPILGDRTGEEAKVVFASGALAREDYEFVIVATPKYERKLCKWTTVENGQTVEHEYWSEWRITLAKTEADMESLGVYQPSSMRNGKAGDFFFFIGIDMPHLYVKWGEERVDNWKKDNLEDKSDIKPTWVVQTDRVRLNNEGKEDALIRKLHPGDTLRLADKRFIEGDYETLYLSSLTKTYREPTSEDAALNPDVEIVLSDRYEVSANPVATLQGEVSALAKQVGSISNVEQIVRAIGDKLYLRKDGILDRSLSPTQFASLLTSLGFRSGIVGGAGWGIYKDAKGNWVIETDRLVARQGLSVNNLVINQAEWQSGEKVESAAGLEITRVEDTGDGYKCYFDQKNGTIANLFKVDDVAYCNRFTPENDELKTYRRRVMSVEENAVILTKGYTPVQLPDGTTDTGVNGAGVPEEGDALIHRGSYTDPDRQFIKVRDVIGGGYERYIEGLNSVNAEGVEYYFVGRINGESPRWFIGNRDKEAGSGKLDGSYMEYKDGQFNLSNMSLVTRAFYDGMMHTLSGMNGTYSPLLGGRTIGTWWGGDMIDRFDADNNPITPAPIGAATSLVRLDGSGYFSNGMLKWDKRGNLTIGAGVTISDGSNSRTLAQILNYISTINSLLVPVDENFNELPWDEIRDAQGGLKAKALKSILGFFSEQFISTRGTSDGTSGGGGGIDEEFLREWLVLNGYLKRQTADELYQPLGSYLTRAVADTLYQPKGSYLTASALSGYATQQWVEGKGYLTASALTPYALASTLSSHIGDTGMHVSAAERMLWNNTANSLSAILGADSDTIINKWEEVVAFLDTYTEADTLAGLLGNKVDKVAGKGLSTNDFTDALLGKLNGIEAGANKYIHPTAGANTAIAAAAGKVLSSITVDGMGHVTAVGSKTLDTSDIPALAISKITGLQTALDGKMDKTVFDDLFEKVNIGTTSAPVWAIRAKYGLYSNEWISTRGIGDGSGGGGGIDEAFLAQWMVDNGYAKLTDIPSLAGYATESWVNSQGFLKSITKSQVEAVLTGNITSHTHNSIKDAGDGRTLQFNYSTAALGYDAFTWVAVWNGNTLQCVNKNVFAPSSALSSYLKVDGSNGTANGVSALLNKLTEGTSVPTDADYYICQWAGGGTATTTYHRRPVSALWSYIKGKTDALYQPTGNYVTLDTAQTITGTKTFTAPVIAKEIQITGSASAAGSWIKSDQVDNLILQALNKSMLLLSGNENAVRSANGLAGTISLGTSITPWSNVYANNFIKSGGTSSQFLKADGSVDGNSYVPWSKASLATVNGTNLNPQFFNIENEALISDYGGYWSVINLGSYSQSNYRSQIAFPYVNSIADTDMFIRTANSNVWRAWRRVLHDGNYSSILDDSYVKKSGDTMTGKLTINTTDFGGQLNVHRNANAISAIKYSNSEGILGYIGITHSSDSDIPNDLVYYKGAQIARYRIWHSGNDGAGSGLDADLLDGVHKDDIVRVLRNPSSDTNLNDRWVGGGIDITSWDFGHTGNVSNQPIANNNAGCVVSFGTMFPFQIYSDYFDTSKLFYRSCYNSNFKDWRRFAFTDSNVASATKLATARKIYGVDFDGSGNVNGAFFWTTDDASLRIYGDVNPNSHSSYGAETLVLQSCFDGQDPQTSTYVTSYGSRCILAMQPRGGRVAIGKLWADYLLDVNGTAYATKGQFGTGTSTYALNAASFICDSWVRTKGATGWYNETYGGGWYISDTTWIRNHQNRNLYMNTAIIRTDGQIQVGDGGSKFKVDSTGLITQNAPNAGFTNNAYFGCSGLGAGNTCNITFGKAQSAYNLGYIGHRHVADGSTSNGIVMGGHSADNLVFMRYDGNVGVGTLTPDYKLAVNGTGWYTNNLTLGQKLVLGNSAGSNYIVGSQTDSGGIWWDDTKSTQNTNLEIYSHWGIAFKTSCPGLTNTGKITIGINTRDGELHARGDIRSWTKLSVRYGELKWDDTAGAIYTDSGFYSTKFISTKGTADSSDMRLKRVVGAVELTLEQIAAAPLFTFKWRDGSVDGEFLGTSAQYWERILPQSVMRLGKYRSMFYGQTALAAAVVANREIIRIGKSHHRWLEKHESRLQKLERENRELRKEIEVLKSKNA